MMHDLILTPLLQEWGIWNELLIVCSNFLKNFLNEKTILIFIKSPQKSSLDHVVQFFIIQ